MAPGITEDDLRAALPQLDGDVSLMGLTRPVTVLRDELGVPHVEAASTGDAFFAQGFVTAQDRLFQMDFDRRRARGRTAEWLGALGVAQDTMARKLRLMDSARADYRELSPEARGVLEAYAAGVNAFLKITTALPVEYTLLGEQPEPWRPFDGLAIFKIRHVFMGNFELKLWRTRILARLGPELTAKLFPDHEPRDLLIIPTGSEHSGRPAETERILASIATVATDAVSGTDDSPDAGSNSWAIAGSRTASGKPIVAGDSHRAPDTPNVYYQNRVACPEFDVVGLSMPGVPGFHHFGHNANVAWCITHASADYQDLFLERFDPVNPSLYEHQGGWHEADARLETIAVRDGEAVTVEAVETVHGPVILGNPGTGAAVTLRYTATATPNPWAETLLPTLRATNVQQLEEAQQRWVDPANSLVSADVDGAVSYLMRGQIPVRSRTNGWGVVPGWSGDHEWLGDVPFEELPRLRDPEEGVIVTANNRIVDSAFPHYISTDWYPDQRARRVLARLRDIDDATPERMAGVHADSASLLAQQLVRALERVAPAGTHPLLDALRGWDGRMDRDRREPLLYSALMDEVLRRVLTPLLGSTLAWEALAGTSRGGPAHLRTLKRLTVRAIETEDTALLPERLTWSRLIDEAAQAAMAWLQGRLGPDEATWTWGDLHRIVHQHPLSPAFPDAAVLLDPPQTPVGGDSETPLQGGYSPGRPFVVTATSVARYVYDTSAWDASLWAIPLGVSGHPGSPHYADQRERWAAVGLFPMRYAWQEVQANAESELRLLPG